MDVRSVHNSLYRTLSDDDAIAVLDMYDSMVFAVTSINKLSSCTYYVGNVSLTKYTECTSVDSLPPCLLVSGKLFLS